MSISILVGDALQVLRTLQAESFHCCVTSPPYWGLRDYGVAGQLGLEATPEEHVERMVEVFREVRRVLRPDGTAWVNYGDSYVSGQGGRQSACGELPPTIRRDRPEPKERPDLDNAPSGWAERAVAPRTYPGRESGLKPKDLVGMPWRIAFALQADGWWLRSDIIWHKPNPMPESVTDRPTKAHEYIFLLSKAARYFYDAEAVKEESTMKPQARLTPRDFVNGKDSQRAEHRRPDYRIRDEAEQENSCRNLRSVWSIPTSPFPGAHFATFPPDLAKRCILAGTSEKGCCGKCGAPWQRVVDVKYENPGNRTTNGTRSLERRHETAGFPVRLERNAETATWEPGCACSAAVAPCRVLDPFGGAGTTGLVADRHGRDCTLIELNPAYAKMAERRIRDDAPMLVSVTTRAVREAAEGGGGT